MVQSLCANLSSITSPEHLLGPNALPIPSDPQHTRAKGKSRAVITTLAVYQGTIARDTNVFVQVLRSLVAIKVLDVSIGFIIQVLRRHLLDEVHVKLSHTRIPNGQKSQLIYLFGIVD